MKHRPFHLFTTAALAFAATVCLTALVRAAPVDYEEPDFHYTAFTKKAGKWETASNWTKKAVPSLENTVVIRDNNGVSVSSKVASITGMHLGGKGNSVLTISTGGELELQKRIRIGRNEPNTEGVLVLDGGILRTGLGNNDSTGHRLNIGESMTHSSRGRAIFNSGTFEGGICIGSAMPNTGVGTLSIIGSAPTVRAKNKRDAFYAHPFACIEFMLDAEGCATLDFTAASVKIAKGASIRIDGGAHAEKSRSIVLIDSKNAKDEGATIECVNFPEGYSANAAFDKQRGLVLKIKAK